MWHAARLRLWWKHIRRGGGGGVQFIGNTVYVGFLHGSQNLAHFLLLNPCFLLVQSFGKQFRRATSKFLDYACELKIPKTISAVDQRVVVGFWWEVLKYMHFLSLVNTTLPLISCICRSNTFIREYLREFSKNIDDRAMLHKKNLKSKNLLSDSL